MCKHERPVFITQLAKTSIDPEFFEVTADVFIKNIQCNRMSGVEPFYY